MRRFGNYELWVLNAAMIRPPLVDGRMPRWMSDANFMTAVGETRVLPESLEETYAKLKGSFSE
ncbi:MAG: hypothetical protein ACRD45_14985 [Bryobacteraceae bacterium]